jgi:Bacterial SH3 domain
MRVARSVVGGLVVVAGMLAFAPSALAQGQPQRGGQGRAEQADPNARVLATVRIPTRHANVHGGPNTSSELLVMVPKGATLDMIGRRGEWIQVRLTPEVRKSGIPMRWFKNENNGWLHDSTVEFVTPEQKF